MNKSQNAFLSKHKSSVISKKRIYLWPAVVSALFTDLFYLHVNVLGKCHAEHITEPIHIDGILYPWEV